VIDHKKCTHCGKDKNISEFGRLQNRDYCDECKGKLDHELGLIKYYLTQIKQKWQKIK
jgi:hypothetical protein